ncbi:MAG: hypothetical protein Q8M16_15650 [Pirellulaceae bacterium]|nr:hypothetical protein [Pirellulaceae bacterium]
MTSPEVFNGPIRLLTRESATPDRTMAIVVASVDLDRLWLTVLPNSPAE